MQQTVSRQVRLRLTKMTFVSSLAEFDRGPRQEELVIDEQVWWKLVRWAEAHGWRSPGRSYKVQHVPRHALANFLARLTEAVESAPAEQPGPRGRVDVDGPLRAFFGTKKNKRQLEKVIEFLRGGGDLVVEDA